MTSRPDSIQELLEILQAEDFRDWLVDVIQGTSLVRRRLKDADIDYIAKQMGLQPDVVREARIQRMLELTRDHPTVVPDENALPPVVKKRRHSRQCWFSFRVPIEYRSLLASYARSRGMASEHGVVRTAIHHYLLHPWEPPILTQWHGPDLRIYSHEEAKGISNLRTTVTFGSSLAFATRAEARSVTRTTILKSLLLPMLRGEWARPREVTTVSSAREMFDDPKRYVLPA